MVTHSKMSLGAESVRERRITRIVQHSTKGFKKGFEFRFLKD
jgi:hypothetical protein